jgi:hypothetical protein
MAILWAAHYGCKYYDEYNSDLPIRMADAAAFSVAWYDKIYDGKDTLMEMLESNQEKVAALPLEADIFASYFIKFMEEVEEWSGYAQKLYDNLSSFMPEKSGRKFFPTSPNVLGKRIAVLKPSFEAVNIMIKTEKKTTGTFYTIRKVGKKD